MKKALFLFIFLSSPSIAAEFTVSDLSAGMYSFPSSNVIPDNSASLIQNMYTDIEPMAVERNGYVKRDSTSSVLGGTKSVTGLWEFISSGGDQWIISYSSRTYYKNRVNEQPSVLGPVSTTDQIPDCTVNLGRLWCTNGVDSVFSFDGTSTATISGAPLGRLIESWRTRLVISDITSARTTVRVSEDGDGTSWTIGTTETSPFSFTVGGANDGFVINCLYGSYIDSLIIGRARDLWALSGFDQTDVSLRQISSEIGCIQDRSVRELDNTLIFLSRRGLEEMRGITITNISEPVRNYTNDLAKNTSNLREHTDTSATDWLSGSFSSSVYVDTETASGSIRFIYPDYFSSYRDGTLGTKKVWETYLSGTSPGTLDVSGGYVNLNHVGSNLGRVNLFTSTKTLTFTAGTTYHFTINDIPVDTGNLSDFYFTLRTATVSAPSNPDASGTLVINFTSTEASKISIANLTLTGRSGSASTTVNFAVPATIDVFLSATVYQIKINDTVALSGTHSATAADQHVYMGYVKGSAGAGTCKIDNFGIAPQNTVFTSEQIAIGTAITAWGPFTADDTTVGNGSVTYEFDANSTPPFISYTPIVSGQTPTDGNEAFASVRSSFSATAWNDESQLNEYTITWSEGSFPPVASFVYDRRYWIAFTTSTAGSPYNDFVLVWQRNKSWTSFAGIFASSFAIWRDNLYFGNSNNTGYVYKFDTGNTDDGSDIVSKIKTKSYDLGVFHKQKNFTRLYTNFLGNASFSGSFTMDYDLDRSGTTYALGSASLSEDTGGVAAKFQFPLSNTTEGRELQYTLTKSGSGDRLKLYSFHTIFDLKEER